MGEEADDIEQHVISGFHEDRHKGKGKEVEGRPQEMGEDVDAEGDLEPEVGYRHGG